MWLSGLQFIAIVSAVAAVGAFVMGLLSLMIPYWSQCRGAVHLLRSSVSQQYSDLKIPMPDEEFLKRVSLSIARVARQDVWFRQGFSGMSPLSLLSIDRSTASKFFRRIMHRIVRAIESDVMGNSILRGEFRVWQNHKIPLLMVFVSFLLIVFSLTSQILVAGH